MMRVFLESFQTQYGVSSQRYGLKMLVGALVVSATALGGQGTAHALDYNWVGSNRGSWAIASNWSPKGVPGAADTAFVGAGRVVNVSGNVTVKNLRIGAGAQILNSASIKVTGWTDSDGVVSGSGQMDIPKGATATFELGAGLASHSSFQRRSQASVCQTTHIDFGKITNKGNLNVRVAPIVDVSFDDINNVGGKTTLNALGTTTLVNEGEGPKRGPRPIRRALCQTTPPIEIKSLKNQSGIVTLAGAGSTGRAILGQSIDNYSRMVFDASRTLIQGDYNNRSGSTVTLQRDSLVASVAGTAPKFENYGIVRQGEGDSEVRLEWYNAGKVEIIGGTLRVAPPAGKFCAQVAGSTTLQGGTLEIVNSTTDRTKQGLLLQGGTLGGSGTINGNVRNEGGCIKPGYSPGTITINGNYTQTAGGVLDMEVGGNTPGTGYDQILVNGTAYLGGTLNLVRWGGYVPKSGDVYTLFTYYAKVGSFAKFVDTSPAAGIRYSTTLTPTDYEVNCYSSALSDTTPPVVSIGTPSEGLATRALTNATGTSSDASGIKSVTALLYRYADATTGAPAGYWAGGTLWTATASAANERLAQGTTAWTGPFPVLAAGRYSLRATATDTKGNVSTRTVSFWLDPNAPSVLTVDTPAYNSSVSSLLAVGGTVGDASNGSGIVSVQGQLRRLADGLYWNGSGWATRVHTFSTSLSGTRWLRNTSLPSGLNLKAGRYSVTAIATDRAGNTKTVTSAFSVITSVSAPRA